MCRGHLPHDFRHPGWTLNFLLHPDPGSVSDGKRLRASGQAQEANHTGRGVRHEEEMNQKKCPQVLTASKLHTGATQCQQPSSVSACVPRAKNSNDQGWELAKSVHIAVPKGSLPHPQKSN